jgi:hypothetical protein
MKKMKYGTILLALFLGGYVSLDSASAKDATYSVGILDFPPYAVIEKSGDCKGILVGLIEQVLEQAGIDYCLVTLDMSYHMWYTFFIIELLTGRIEYEEIHSDLDRRGTRHVN